MTLHVDDYELIEMDCMRCAKPARMRFRGLCDDCIGQLDAKYQGIAREVEAEEYVPKMNVTPNAVAVKDD